MEEKLFDDLKKEIEREMEKKKKKKPVTLYLSEENINFLRKKEINISKMVDRFLSSMIVFIKKEKEESEVKKESDEK